MNKQKWFRSQSNHVTETKSISSIRPQCTGSIMQYCILFTYFEVAKDNFQTRVYLTNDSIEKKFLGYPVQNDSLISTIKCN